MDRDTKELIRHWIAKSGLAKIHLRVRRALGENVEHLFESSLESRFSAIYANRVWLNGPDARSLSGSGSELANTRTVRQRLAEILSSLGTQMLLDVGCGDFNWMKEVPLPCAYLGADIVPAVIARNTRLHATDRRTFRLLDAVSGGLPPADTILCREVMFHLSFRDIGKLLANIRKSGADYLIATNDTSLRRNADILSGDFRLLNLQAPPFGLPSPRLTIADDAVSAGRTLSVWHVKDIPSGLVLSHGAGEEAMAAASGAMQ